MSELIVAAIVPLTLLLSILLLVHTMVLQNLGANAAYLSWLAVPMGLMIYTLLQQLLFVDPIVSSTNNFERILIYSTKAIQQVSDSHWLVLFSTCVSGLLILFSFINHLYFKHKLLAKSRKLDHSNLPVNSTDIIAMIGNRSLEVNISKQIQSPIILGVMKPYLVLPGDFFTLYNLEQQQLILSHEICHFDRNDIYWNLLAFAFLALFWFHPLVWLAYFRFRRDQELSCDQTTLARKPFESRINYSRALLITAQKTPKLAFAHLSFNEYGDKAVMLERIKQIKSTRVLGKSVYALFGLIAATLISSISYASYVGQEGIVGAKTKQFQVMKNVYPTMRVEPIYPGHAAKDNIEGAVLLKFDVDAQGNTTNIRIVASEPENVFDQVSIDALAQWQYSSEQKMLSRNHMVQLDYLLSAESKPRHLVERIQVSH